MKKILILYLFLANAVGAQTTNELFNNANTKYKEGNYEEAIKIYEQIKQQGKVSSELYYNLGNTYYKLNKIAPSIYNYEKALKLNPLNKDATNNLIFAKRAIIDKIEALPKTFLQKLEEKYLQKLSYNTWALIAVLASFLASILFLLYYFSSASSKKRLFFITSIISFLLLVLSLTVAFRQYNLSKKDIQAIVFAEKVTVKNGPTFNADDAFTLHEGTKVFVLDAVDDWKKIKLEDGKIGWMPKSDLKEI